jgi:hypothetical protein
MKANLIGFSDMICIIEQSHYKGYVIDIVNIYSYQKHYSFSEEKSLFYHQFLGSDFDNLIGLSSKKYDVFDNVRSIVIS